MFSEKTGYPTITHGYYEIYCPIGNQLIRKETFNALTINKGNIVVANLQKSIWRINNQQEASI